MMKTKPGHNTSAIAPVCDECLGGGYIPAACGTARERECGQCQGSGHYCPGGEVRRTCGDGVLFLHHCDALDHAHMINKLDKLVYRVCTTCGCRLTKDEMEEL